MSLSLKEWMEDNAYLFRYAGEMGCMRENADDILLVGDAAAFLAPLFHQIFPKACIQASADDSVIEEVREEYPALLHASHPFEDNRFDIIAAPFVPSFLESRDFVSFLFSVHSALRIGGNLYLSFLESDKPYQPASDMPLWWDESRTAAIKKYRSEDVLQAMSLVGFDIKAIEKDTVDVSCDVVSIQASRR